MIKKVVRIRCDECFLEFKRHDFVTVLTPKLEYPNGADVEHVCRNCYNKGYMGLPHTEQTAESLTRIWKDKQEA